MKAEQPFVAHSSIQYRLNVAMMWSNRC